MGDVTGLGTRIGHLGRRVLVARRTPARVGGSRLARAVLTRHRPPLLEAATRLARGRSMAAPVARAMRTATAPEPSAPASLSDFAAGWLFSEGEPEGVPFADGATVPESLKGPPSFLANAAAEEAPAPAPVRRGPVEEMGPFRLSRTPAAAPPEPAAEEVPESTPEHVAPTPEPPFAASPQPAVSGGPEMPTFSEAVAHARAALRGPEPPADPSAPAPAAVAQPREGPEPEDIPVEEPLAVDEPAAEERVLDEHAPVPVTVVARAEAPAPPGRPRIQRVEARIKPTPAAPGQEAS